MNEPLSSRPRHLATQSLPYNLTHKTPPRSSTFYPSEAGTQEDIEKLYWDNADESFELPDFHYDWETSKGKKPEVEAVARETSRLAEVSLNRFPNTLRRSPSHPAAGTPPSRTTPSAQSSASSAHVMSLTDGSSVSASSFVPTPPNAGILVEGRSVSSQGSGGSGSGGTGRSYGGARKFQRVVSAPLTRQRYEEERYKAGGDESNNLSFTTSTHPHTQTATVRPPLIHASSASSIHSDDAANNPPSDARSHFITPALTERRLVSTAASTGRRLGGLSRFGGPARRLVAPPETGEGEGEGEDKMSESPALIASPNLDSLHRRSPSENGDRRSSYGSGSSLPKLGSRSPPDRSGIPPHNVDEAEPLSEWTYSDRPGQSTSTHPSIYQPRPASPALAKRPYRPLQAMYRDHVPADSIDHRGDALPDTSRKPYASIEPERPSSYVHPSGSSPPATDATSESRPVSVTSTLRASRPAPIAPLPMDSKIPSQPTPVTAFQQPAQYTLKDTVGVQSQPVVGINRQFVVGPYRTMMICSLTLAQVNGKPYTRLAVLGTGGSSKVYSVLSTDKTVYALKKVDLRKGDDDTLQSYLNEIDLLKRLQGHDRIIQLIDHELLYSSNNRHKALMVIMECGEIDFASLLDQERGKPVNMNFVGLYWEQAVHAVHEEKVVHTDLKPANFVLVKGRLKIIDFGIAKAVANDTVNIQRDTQVSSRILDVADEQIGTVNYMSPEAIQRMNGQNVLKMVYGNPPFHHINGGPMIRLNAIANPNHKIDYPEVAVPRPVIGRSGQTSDQSNLAVSVNPAVIDSMMRCLAYRKEHRHTIPELLLHEFLKPSRNPSALPLDSTSITSDQMRILVDFVIRQNKLPPLPEDDTTAAVRSRQHYQSSG
ncbi:serine/threonine-protein kinase TTK/MPS1, partial [Tremellales sp. Uapishka_1]